jgi:TonB family protein
VASPASNTSRAAEASASTGGAPSNRPAVDVTAITTRDDFLLELGDALGGQAAVRPVDSVQVALDHLSNTKRGQVLIVDTRDVSDVRSDVERAHSHAPHAVILVFATAEAEKQIGAAVKGSNVFAVLPIPIDKRKTGAVLEAALSDSVAKRAQARPAAPSAGVSVEPFQPQAEPAPASADDGSGSKGKLALYGGVGFAVIAAAAGVFYFMSQGKHPAPTAIDTGARKTAAAPTSAATQQPAAADDASLAPKPVVETSIVKGKVDELLEKARSAMRERRYTEPTGDNALLYYRSASAADPTNGEALDGLQRLAAVLASRFDESMAASKFEDAALSLANLKAAAPKDARIPALELKLMTGQINKALADGNVDRAAALVRQAQQSMSISGDQLNKWRTEVARRQEDAKLQRLASLISDRIRDGKLVEPADDSAKTYMQQLHEAAPTNATTVHAASNLNSAYMHKARDALMARNQAEADRWLAEAKAGGVNASELQNFQRDALAARQKATAAEAERLAQLARERIRDGKLSDPAQDSAAYYLSQLQTIDPSNSATAQINRDLTTKVLDRARVAAKEGNKAAQVDADLTLAKHLGADASAVAAIQQIQSAPRSAASSTRAAAPQINVAQLAQQLKRTRSSPPEYPTVALNKKMGGVVTVEFTVDKNGDPRDVHVVEATPPGVFEKSALTAVKKWHYEPLSVNGQLVEIPVRTSIRFEPPK